LASIHININKRDRTSKRITNGHQRELTIPWSDKIIDFHDRRTILTTESFAANELVELNIILRSNSSCE
jgi:hypothetical protein